MRDCGHILPPATEYGWDLCEPCRARVRHGKRRNKMRAPASADAEHDIALTIPNPDQIQDQEISSGGESEDIPPVRHSDAHSPGNGLPYFA
jgi:hypothetical protein